MKTVLINFHMVKNAGGTIEGILEKNFRKEFAMTKYGTKMRKIIPTNALIEYFSSNPEIKAFSSHAIRPPLQNTTDLQFFSILSIRHPIDRAVSIYHFTKRSKLKGEYSIQAKKSSLREFIDWNLKNEKHFLLDSQFRLFRNTSNFLHIKKLTSVENQIRNCLFLVIVDRFDESMVVAEENLKQYFKNLDFSYIKRHVRKEREESISDRLKTATEEIGEKIMQDLIDKNKKDLKIYNISNDVLDSRIQKISNFEDKVDDFKRRCVNMNKENMPNKEKRLLLYSEEHSKLLETK